MTRHRRKIGPVLSVAGCLFASTTMPPSRAHAAMIDIVGRRACSLRLSGPIKSGDFAAFKKLLQNKSAKSSLCLDSEGGDFAEAMKFIGYINDPQTGSFLTVVDERAVCRAECVLIFMAGRRTEFHAIKFPWRHLHVAGLLDLRPPASASSTGTANAAAVATTYAGSVASISQILSQEHEHGDPGGYTPLEHNRTYPLSMLLAMFGAERGQPYPLATIEQAGRWGIDLFGAPSIEPTDAWLLQACKNLSRWNGILNGDAEDIRPGKPRMVSPDLIEVSLRGREASDRQTCMANRFKDLGGAYTVSVQFSGAREKRNPPDAAAVARDNRKFGLEAGIWQSATPLWSGLPPDTRLDSLRAK